MIALSGSLHGSGRSRTALTTLKMAAFAPMPSASVSVAMVAKVRLRRRVRAPYRRSCRKVSSAEEAFMSGLDGAARENVCLLRLRWRHDAGPDGRSERVSAFAHLEA